MFNYIKNMTVSVIIILSPEFCIRKFDLRKFSVYLSKTSKDVDGNGWGILGYQPFSNKLTIFNVRIMRSLHNGA